MNVRHSLAAVALTAALSLAGAAPADAGFNFDNFQLNFGNGFNITFGGNRQNFFRRIDRVRFDNRILRREIRRLPFGQQFALDRLTKEVDLRIDQLDFAVRTDNRRLIQVRARQLANAVNEIEFTVDRLPIRTFTVNELNRAARNLDFDVRQLLRSL